MLAEKNVLTGQLGRANILDWRSHTCDRVCRSTFAAETMSCAEAMEASQLMRSMLVECLQSGFDLGGIASDVSLEKQAIEILEEAQ